MVESDRAESPKTTLTAEGLAAGVEVPSLAVKSTRSPVFSRKSSHLKTERVNQRGRFGYSGATPDVG